MGGRKKARRMSRPITAAMMYVVVLNLVLVFISFDFLSVPQASSGLRTVIVGGRRLFFMVLYI